MKDDLSMVLLMHTGFGDPFVDNHYDLIGPLSLLYVDVRCDCRNVGGMGGIHRFDDCNVSGYFFQTVVCYFLPKNLSKALSFCFVVLFSFVDIFRFL